MPDSEKAADNADDNEPQDTAVDKAISDEVFVHARCST